MRLKDFLKQSWINNAAFAKDMELERNELFNKLDQDRVNTRFTPEQQKKIIKQIRQIKANCEKYLKDPEP